MWNSIACNSHYDDFLKEKESRRLYKSLSKVKSIIDNKNPKKVPHLKTRSKKYQLQKEIKEDINYKNQILMEKMFNINGRALPPKISKPLSNKSLNKQARSKNTMKINKENSKILVRLQSARPVLSAQKWKSEEKYRLRLKNIIQKHRKSSVGAESSKDSEPGDMLVKIFQKKPSRPSTAKSS